MIILILILLFASTGVSFMLFKKYIQLQAEHSDRQTKRNEISKAEKLAELKIQESEEKLKEAQSVTDSKLAQERRIISERKNYIKDQEAIIESRIEIINEQSDTVQKKEEQLKEEEMKIEVAMQTLQLKLSEIVQKDKASIAEEIKQFWESSLDDMTSKKVKESIVMFERSLDERIEESLNDLTPHISVDFYAEPSSSYIELPRKIKKEQFEGKNREILEKLEQKSGAEILFDEAKFEYKVSCLDPIRREVVSRTLNQMLLAKNLTVEKAEKIFEKEKATLLDEVLQGGTEAAKDMGFPDLPKKIIISLGKCKFRFSYGQNLLKHSIEMAQLGDQLACLFNADRRITKLACFLHDIGKVESHEGEQHHHISAEIVKEYDDNPVLYNAIIAHHYDIDAEYLEAQIVRIADGISGSRPGARRYSAEEYFEKIRALEDIAQREAGVQKAYAIQAGREVRVYVDPTLVDDDKARGIAKQVAENIEEEMSYPGIIKVQVIRETIATQKTADTK